MTNQIDNLVNEISNLKQQLLNTDRVIEQVAIQDMINYLTHKLECIRARLNS